MKASKLRVGLKKPVKFSVTVEIQTPETPSEAVKLARTDAVLMRWVNRARGIELQEQEARHEVSRLVGERLQIKGAKLDDPTFVAEVTKVAQACVDRFDPTIEAKRGGRPAKPVKVSSKSLDAALKLKGSERVAALAGLGLKVELLDS